MKLTQEDIEDVANGYHNKYVEAQDKDELIKYLAQLLTKQNRRY